jgi:hypothetical protein
MPAGNDLAQQVKHFDPATQVILVKEPGNSGRNTQSAPWIDAVLTKPFRIDDLEKVLLQETMRPVES